MFEVLVMCLRRLIDVNHVRLNNVKSWEWSDVCRKAIQIELSEKASITHVTMHSTHIMTVLRT